MPVDRSGKITFRNPADRYATPINRKPRRRKKPLIICLVIFVLILAIPFCQGFFSTLISNFQNPVHTDWPAILTMQSTGNAQTAPVRTTDVWQLTWTCELGKPMEIDVLDEQGSTIQSENALCTWGNTSGAAEMNEVGTVRLSIISQGSWTVSIREQK